MGNEEGVQPDIHTLIADHHAALYAYALRLTARSAEAEDLTQQTFLVAHQKIAQLREADRARGWLYRILRNAFLKNRRKPEPSVPDSASRISTRSRLRRKAWRSMTSDCGSPWSLCRKRTESLC